MSQNQTEKITHLFGEMDLDLSKTAKEIAHRACSVASDCGYSVQWSKDNEIILGGEDCPDSEYSKIVLIIKDDKVSSVEKRLYDYTTNNLKTTFIMNDTGDYHPEWREKGTEVKGNKVTSKTLDKYISSIAWTVETSLPMMPAMAIQTLIKEHGIPAKQWGYFHDLIGIETKKQIIIWRDQGSHIEFIGIKNKEIKIE